METFLGIEAFSDACVAAFTGSYAGQAAFDGCIACCNWPSSDVARILPPELALAENRSARVDLHPVAFVFGEQRQGATIFGGITFPLGVNYHELALAVPFVKHRQGQRLHTFVPRMYSSFYPATWAGNAHYGLGKEMATMSREATRFVVAAQGRQLVEASWDAVGDWMPGAGCELPNFDAMRRVFALPVMGRRADGSYVTSYFGWDFGAAQVRAARLRLSIDQELGPGLVPRRCAGLELGTFEVRRMIWRLSWPEPSRF
jgi:hypothetical protein